MLLRLQRYVYSGASSGVMTVILPAIFFYSIDEPTGSLKHSKIRLHLLCINRILIDNRMLVIYVKV